MLLFNTWEKVSNLGIHSGLTFYNKKKIRLLNKAISIGSLIVLFYLILNIYQGNRLLIIINTIMLIGNMLFLFFNHLRLYKVAHILIGLGSIAMFTLSALTHFNSVEYALIVNLVVVVIIFEDLIYVLIFSLLNCAAFLYVKSVYFKTLDFQIISAERNLANIGVLLLFFILFLQYFKKEHISYQLEIENKNQLLETQKGQLEEQNQELQTLNTTKEKLFSIIAHDMRSPIAGLKNVLDLISMEIISKEEFTQLVEKLKTRVENLNYNMDNLLAWSFSQLEGINVVPEKTELKSTLLQTLSLFIPNLQSKQIQVNQNIEEDIFIYVDPNHLKIIIRNLVSNAIKYSFEGGNIWIDAKKSGNILLLSIKDSGIGMSQDKIIEIFKSKNKQSTPGTQQEKGTGLGLLLCKEFSEKNGGQVTVESHEGKGTTFTVSFPIA